MARPVRLPNGGRARAPLLSDAIAQWPGEGDMNRTERHYATSILEPMLQSGRILWYSFEPWKLRLGPSNFYTPDFGLITSEFRIECHEIKAVWSSGKVGYKDDARQKVRDAAQFFPFFRFIVAAHRSKKAMRQAGTTEQWIFELIKVHEQRPPPV